MLTLPDFLEEYVGQPSRRWASILNTSPGYTMTATDTDIREVEKMFAVNVFGPMRMVRYFHRMLIAAQGVIVNIGSIGGVIPYIYGGTYNQVDSV
jgi:1-acylglycerone phosphate reductase